MSADVDTPKKRFKHPDRICLDPKNLEKVDRWIESLMASSQGIRITRKDLVNWILESKADALSKEEQKELGSRFYDDVRHIEQLLKAAKAARASGEASPLEALKAPQKRSSESIKRSHKSKDSSSNTTTISSVEVTGEGD